MTRAFAASRVSGVSATAAFPVTSPAMESRGSPSAAATLRCRETRKTTTSHRRTRIAATSNHCVYQWAMHSRSIYGVGINVSNQGRIDRLLTRCAGSRDGCYDVPALSLDSSPENAAVFGALGSLRVLRGLVTFVATKSSGTCPLIMVFMPPERTLGTPHPSICGALNLTYDYLADMVEAARRRERVMAAHTTGTRNEWLTARLELLEAEKELTRRSDGGAPPTGTAVGSNREGA